MALRLNPQEKSRMRVLNILLKEAMPSVCRPSLQYLILKSSPLVLFISFDHSLVKFKPAMLVREEKLLVLE
jgi:hypothetical protein